MKNKGIAIELTALLDVIFIMLFWCMTNMQEQTEDIRQSSEEQISQAYSQAENYRQELQQAKQQYEYDVQRLEKELESALKKAENPEKTARENQEALDRYSQGIVVTLVMNYDAVGKLFISDNNSELGKTLINSPEEVASTIENALEKNSFDKDEVILCALVYDGSRALYKDVQTVTEAVGIVSESYSRIYCTYINTSA